MTEQNTTLRPESPLNIKRTPEFIKIKHSVNSCLNLSQLETLREIIIKYYKDKKDGGAELMAEFLFREGNLSGEIRGGNATQTINQ